MTLSPSHPQHLAPTSLGNAHSRQTCDITANGSASGRLTINSLALLGTDIRLRGDDPMGTDKFSRFNQTLQEYLDGAARSAVAAG